MRYHALAVDYDGTLATHGQVPDDVLQALERVRASGRKLVLVTGREVDDLWRVFPRLDVFDRVVAENGAVVHDPATREQHVLVEPPPPSFAAALRQLGVEPVHVGHVVVATREPHQTTVLETIRKLGLELHVAFNKGAVMVLPAGVNKRFGLHAALDGLGLSAHNVVGVGDAENDHAFLDACECAVAVANALPAVKVRADFVTSSTHGAGVMEVIERLERDDLASLAPALERHSIALGTRAGGKKRLRLEPYGTGLLVAGTPKAGKSTLVMSLVERLQEHGYQFCLIDPEGDYERLPDVVNLGDPRQAPSAEAVVEVLEEPDQNVCVSLLSVSGAERPSYFARLCEALGALHTRSGRPHWLIVDEAHHLLPPDLEFNASVKRGFGGLALVTLNAHRLAPGVFDLVNLVVAVGDKPDATLEEIAARCGEPAPQHTVFGLSKGEALVWRRGNKRAHLVKLAQARTKRRRHRRKYAEGELPPDESFYFRGPNNALELRAQNLEIFMQIADGLDAATWEHHLRAGDYSRWIAESLKDKKLADRIACIERQETVPIEQSRAAIRALIEERYAPPTG